MRLDLLFKPVKSESELKVAMASCGFAFLRKFPCYSVASGRKSHSVAALEVESSDQQNQLKIWYPKTPFLPSIVCELHVLLNLILDEGGIFSLCTTAPSWVPVYFVHRLRIFSVATVSPWPYSDLRASFTFYVRLYLLDKSILLFLKWRMWAWIEYKKWRLKSHWHYGVVKLPRRSKRSY